MTFDQRAYQVEYRKKYPDVVKQSNQRYYQSHKSDPHFMVTHRNRPGYSRDYWMAHKSDSHYKETASRANRNYREKKQQQLFDIFGDHCRCCGESNKVFLTLNHINGDGADERRRLTGNPQSGSMASWREAIRTKDHTRYEILCYNCNNAVKDGRVCPHKLSQQKK